MGLTFDFSIHETEMFRRILEGARRGHAIDLSPGTQEFLQRLSQKTLNYIEMTNEKCAMNFSAPL